jgi:hypothetical protein
MKRIIGIFLAILLTKIIAFSEITSNPIENDSTVLVTVSDIKYANLIFVEHKNLQSENTLLKQQLSNYEELNSELTEIDLLREQQLNTYKKANENYSEQVANLNKQLSNKTNTVKYWKIGGISVSAALLLLLIFK